MNKIISAAVIGNPINQSLSPKMHNFLLEKYDIAGYYISLEIEEENFEPTLHNLIKSGFKGFNITIPFKEKALSICDNLSKSAQEISAVNTITILKNGKIYGHNSDAYGFIQNIKSNIDIQFKNKKITLLGAGGSAKAIAYGLMQEKVQQITIINRNLKRAENLVNNLLKINSNTQFKIAPMSEVDKHLSNADLLINSTSLGMNNKSKLDINLDKLKPDAIVSDIVYKPLITPLLQQAQDKNLRIVTGIDMLIHQGLVGFELWFGKNIPNDDLDSIRNHILQESH